MAEITSSFIQSEINEDLKNNFTCKKSIYLYVKLLES